MARLGIDIDGVLYNWDSAVIEILQTHDLPEELTLEQALKLENGSSQSWSWVEDVVGKANFNWLWRHANETRMFLRGDDYDESLDALTVLSLQHEVFLLTSRPAETWWQTYKWLGHPSNGLRVKGVIHGSIKARTAVDLDLRVLVDDNADMLKGYLSKAFGGPLKGAFVYGQKRPWNRDLGWTSYYRFRWVDSLVDLLPDQERWDK